MLQKAMVVLAISQMSKEVIFEEVKVLTERFLKEDYTISKPEESLEMSKDGNMLENLKRALGNGTTPKISEVQVSEKEFRKYLSTAMMAATAWLEYSDLSREELITKLMSDESF